MQWQLTWIGCLFFLKSSATWVMGHCRFAKATSVYRDVIGIKSPAPLEPWTIYAAYRLGSRNIDLWCLAQYFNASVLWSRYGLYVLTSSIFESFISSSLTRTWPMRSPRISGSRKSLLLVWPQKSCVILVGIISRGYMRSHVDRQIMSNPSGVELRESRVPSATSRDDPAES